ncbi:MAG: type II toxin-antitoxin system RelB/DinJ family antitoxin [Deinococcota bacterium]|jgi:DNA-damage-inducible protein J|nr:type II toxin-antitoxin system RelB/DinJ family antitoxin [Deinococcota bacterium]
MPKTEQVNVRMNPEVKTSAEAVFRELGMTPTQAITLFYHQVSLQQGLPFELKIPNAETQVAMSEVQGRHDLNHYDTTEDLKKALGL